MIAGAGTIGLEIVDAMPEFDVVIIPLGGGGLASGMGLAIKAAAPGATIVGVEVEASSPFTLSLEAGRITEITPRPSLADGLVGNLEPGSMTFQLVKQVVDYVVTVSEDDLTRAMKGLATEERLIVEGAGAAAVASILAGKASAPGQRVVAMVTGGNVDLPKWLLTNQLTVELRFWSVAERPYSRFGSAGFAPDDSGDRRSRARHLRATTSSPLRIRRRGPRNPSPPIPAAPS